MQRTWTRRLPPLMCETQDRDQHFIERCQSHAAAVARSNVSEVDKDGQLSFSEFAAGALLLYQDALEDELHYLFETCDKDFPVELQVSTAQHPGKA